MAATTPAGTDIGPDTVPAAETQTRHGMVPPLAARPSVLPTDRLGETGKPIREIRDELRRISVPRNVWASIIGWVQPIVTIVAALVIGHPLAWVAAFVLMGPAHARHAALMHEAAHKLLFPSKRWNDLVGRWLFGYPTFAPMELYRRGHFAHHRDEFGPEEPDFAFYDGYPVPPATLRRRLWRDLRGNSGRKNLTGLLRAARAEDGVGPFRKVIISQTVLAVALSALGVAIAGWVGLLTYPVLWVGSWMTMWKVINRLRSIAEHGGMERSDDRRATTHNVRQNLLARFFVVPLNIGWHLAHHVDMGVPWHNLPALHRELVDAGYVTDEITYPNYRSLWKALATPPPAE